MPRSRSADIPRYDTYPAPAPSEAAATPQDWPYEPPTDVDPRTQLGNRRLNQTAGHIGQTLGRVVSIARTARRRVQSAGSSSGELAGELGERVSERVNALGDQARARMEDLRGQVQDRLHEARAIARERLDDARSRARQRFDNARWRARVRAEQARQYAHQNPLQVIGAAALAGLVLGAGLRLWRSSHDER